MVKKISLPIDTNSNDNIHPKKPDFKWLGIMIGFSFSIFFIIFIIIMYISKIFVANFTIKQEQEYFWKLSVNENDTVFDFDLLDNSEKIKEIFDGFPVYVTQNDRENAFATLWANIFITTGLLDNIKSQEELLFILWHEKRHIENRDVLTSISKELPIIITLEVLWLNFGNNSLDTNEIFSTHLSRQHEYAADDGGIALLKKLEMNTHCATKFFERVGNDFEKYKEFISTHPESKKRLQRIKKASSFPEKWCTDFSYEKIKKS